MQEKSKSKSFFDSLWFNVIMSVVAIVVLVESIIEQSYIRVIVWVVLSFHFIRATIKAVKER